MRKIAVCLVFLAFGTQVMGQIEMDKGEKPSFLDRTYVGGSFNVQFGTYTVVYISPVVGYMITRSLSGGVGVTYQYVKTSSNAFNFKYETNTYGGRLFLRQNFEFFKLPLFAYSEYETLNIEYPVSTTELDRQWYDRLFIGGGLFQPIGRRGGFYILVMYDVMHESLNPFYPSPWEYRIGFTF